MRTSRVSVERGRLAPVVLSIQAEIAVHDNMTIAGLLSAVNHRLWRFAMQRNRGYYLIDS